MTSKRRRAVRSAAVVPPDRGVGGTDPGETPAAGAAATAAGACLALYAVTACRTLPFGDGPELIAAADCLGVAHPPGYPLYTLIGWLVLRIPAGEPAFRMNLLSALFAALACGVVCWLVVRWSRSRLAGLVSAAAFAVSSSWAWVAAVAEVYSLHVLLVTALLAAASVAGSARSAQVRGRALVAAGCVVGAGLAHHPTLVLALPAAAILAAGRRRPFLPEVSRVSAGLAALAILAIPAAAYLGLMARARLDPPSNWGDPSTLRALWNHARAVDFRSYDLGWPGLLRAEAWANLGRAVMGELSPLALPLAVAGLAGWPGPAAPGRFRVALVALAVPTALFGMRWATADVEVFWLPVFLSMALAAGLGVAGLLRGRRRPVRAFGIAVAVVLVAHTAARNLPSRDLSDVTAAASHARDILDTLPEGAILFVESMESFGVLYLTQVVGERPDVTVYHRWGTLFHDLVDDFRVDRAPGEPPRAYRIRNEQVFIARELSRGGRPIFFLSWPGYLEIPPAVRIEPVGLLHHVRLADRPAIDPGPVVARYHEDEVAEQARRTGDPVALAVAASYRVARGERALFEGDRSTAAREFDRAGALATRTAGVPSYIGTVWGRYGDLPRAIEWFRRALRVRPSYTKAWNNLAIAYERSGDDPAAREALRRSLDIDPRQADAAAALARLEGPPPGGAP